MHRRVAHTLGKGLPHRGAGRRSGLWPYPPLGATRSLEVPSTKFFLNGTVPSTKFFMDGTVLYTKFLMDGTVPFTKFLLDGTVPATKHYQKGNEI
jgi:hypothetical protein